MKKPKIDYDRMLEGVQDRNKPQEPPLNKAQMTPQDELYLLSGAVQDTRGKTKSARNIGLGALGVAAIAGAIGGGAYLGQNGNSEKITSLDNRVAGIEQRIGSDILDIRSYLIDGGEEGCDRLGGQVAESNNDRQYGWTDCRFTPEQFRGNPSAFAEEVIKDDYSNDMLALADRIDDLTLDDYDKNGLEALINGGYAGIIAVEAPQRQTAPSHTHTTRTQTTSYTPTTTTAQPKQCGTDVIDVFKQGIGGFGRHGHGIIEKRIDKTGTINDCDSNYKAKISNYIGDICNNNYTVNGSFTQNPASYITQLNGEGGQSQHFSVRCHYNNDSPTVHSGGGDGPVGGGGEPGEPNGGGRGAGNDGADGADGAGR